MIFLESTLSFTIKTKIVFEDNGQVLETSRLRANSLQANADIAQVLANKAAAKSDRTDLLRDMDLDLGTKFAKFIQIFV